MRQSGTGGRHQRVPNRMKHKSPLLLMSFALTSCGYKVETAQVKTAASVTPVVDWSVPDRCRGRVVGSGRRGIPRKAVALTFDDGPSANITPQILDTLRQHHAVATFFVMGQQVKQYPRLLQQEVAQGNVIGYHTYTHALRPTLSQAEREMEQTRQIVQQTIERETVLFRPPYGNTHSNYTRIARAQNYALILWNVSGADTATRDADVVLENCVSNIHSGDIILMHDSSTKAHTVRALPRILTRLEEQGFAFVTIPDLLRQSATLSDPPPVSSHKSRRKTNVQAAQ